MRADKIENENVCYTHVDSSRKERLVVRLISQDQCNVFCSVGLGGNPLIFFSFKSVRSLMVSINTAHWGHCSQHPEEGAAGSLRVGACRGDAEETVLGTCWHRGSG